MAPYRKSVLKPAPGAGAPKGKSQYVDVIYVADILTFPPSTGDGVMLLGNIVLKAGAKTEKVYFTDVTQEASHKYEGEPDAGGFMKMFTGSHPGDELAINEFIQNNIEEPVIILYPADCEGGKRKVLGLPCNPMYMKAEFKDSKEGVKHTLTYEQRRSDRFVAKYYTGVISYAENFVASTTALALNEVSGYVYQLPPSAAADLVTVASNTIAHKKVISLIGSGGTSDAILNSGVSGPVTVVLDNGTPWVAIKDAVINLEVYDGGVVTYLREISRG